MSRSAPAGWIGLDYHRRACGGCVAPAKSLAGPPACRPGAWLKIERDLAARLRAADQHAARLGSLKRIGPVAHLAADQAGHAGVADAAPAAEPDRDVAGFGELEQAGESGIPWGREVAAAEGDQRT